MSIKVALPPDTGKWAIFSTETDVARLLRQRPHGFWKYSLNHPIVDAEVDKLLEGAEAALVVLLASSSSYIWLENAQTQRICEKVTLQGKKLHFLICTYGDDARSQWVPGQISHSELRSIFGQYLPSSDPIWVCDKELVGEPPVCHIDIHELSRKDQDQAPSPWVSWPAPSWPLSVFGWIAVCVLLSVSLEWVGVVSSAEQRLEPQVANVASAEQLLEQQVAQLRGTLTKFSSDPRVSSELEALNHTVQALSHQLAQISRHPAAAAGHNDYLSDDVQLQLRDLSEGLANMKHSMDASSQRNSIMWLFAAVFHFLEVAAVAAILAYLRCQSQNAVQVPGHQRPHLVEEPPTQGALQVQTLAPRSTPRAREVRWQPWQWWLNATLRELRAPLVPRPLSNHVLQDHAPARGPEASGAHGPSAKRSSEAPPRHQEAPPMTRRWGAGAHSSSGGG